MCCGCTVFARGENVKEKFKGWCNSLIENVVGFVYSQKGSILTAVVIVALTIIVMGALIPVLWPMLQATTTNITAISGSDAPTTFLKTMWPIAILVVGLGIVVAIIFYALKKFGVMGGKKG